MINKIVEQFNVDGIDYLRFYFANGESIKAKQLLLSDAKANLIHVVGDSSEIVINLNNVLYYKIYEKGHKNMRPLK